MKKYPLFKILFLLVMLTVAAVGTSKVGAQERSFTLPWSVIGSGGMGGTAGSYTINSTLGQPVAGAVDAASYHLTSGFWTEIVESLVEFFNFLPLIFR